jgi:RNA polymerase sigma-70 factor (ECF subfamily)
MEVQKADQSVLDRARRDFEAQFEAARSGLLRLCRRVLRDEGHAEDAVQEALIIAWEKRDQPDLSHLEGWLRCIAFRVALRMAKKQARIPTESLEQLQEDPAWEVPDPTLTPEEIVVGGSGYAQHLREVMERVCTHREKAVIIAHSEGYSYDEIAEMLDIPAGTARALWTRGRRKILRALEAEEQQAKKISP